MPDTESQATDGGVSFCSASERHRGARRRSNLQQAAPTPGDAMNRRTLVAVVLLSLGACSTAAPVSSRAQVAPTANVESAILALSDSIFAAARARDADRFASFFSDRPDFVYLINTRRVESRDALQATFRSMLSRQSVFDPQWGVRSVQVLSPQIGVLRADFSTRAQPLSGAAWAASGVVTFVAVRDSLGWRVVNWHTSESAS